MPKLKKETIVPTPEADKVINKHAIEDDTYQVDEQKINIKLLKDVFPNIVEQQKKGLLEARPIGRPKSDNPKKPVSIRLSSDVVSYFRDTGKGWQTRVDEVLKEYVVSRKK